MSLGTCQLPECTLAATGVCLQNFAPELCPHRQGYEERPGEKLPYVDEANPVSSVADGDAVIASEGDVAASVLIRPEEVPRLPASTTMSIESADRLRVERRATVVGIVGLPDSGKTACLASMYLLAAKGVLKGFTCVNSETLMAFEQISQGSRRWNEGSPPEQMTAHTEMTDDREAGFLHLRLRRDTDGGLVDLLIPDLPGEWSKALIDQNDTERFEFLKAASVIWVMVDGRQFIDADQISYATYRTECLIERLANFIPMPRPKLILVPSWRDRGEFPADALAKLQHEGKKWNMPMQVVSIASFSNTEVAPGTGLAALIEASVSNDSVSVEFWPEAETVGLERAMLAFRGTQ